METLLVKIFATALALSQVTTAPEAVATQFDRVVDQGAVAQLLRAGLEEYVLLSAFRDHRFWRVELRELSSLGCGYVPSLSPSRPRAKAPSLLPSSSSPIDLPF